MKTSKIIKGLNFVITLLLCLVISNIALAQQRVGGKIVENIIWNGQEVPVIKGEIILKVASGYQRSLVMSKLASESIEVTKVPNKLGWMSARIPATDNLQSALVRYQNTPGVIHAEPNIVMRTTVSVNDLHGNQWSLRNTGQSPANGTNGADIDATKSWDVMTGSSDVVIAVLDSGIPIQNGTLSHPDLNDTGRIIQGDDFIDPNQANGVKDENGHGTHVAGIAAAESNNGIGIAGTCWNCKVLVIQVFDAYGGGTYQAFHDGVVFASDYQHDNPDERVVINFSGGGSLGSTYLTDAIEYAANEDVLIIASAGNENGGNVLYPAAYSGTYDNLVAVSSTDPSDTFSSFSSQGSQVSISAPGGYGHHLDGNQIRWDNPKNIYSTTPNYSFTMQYDPVYQGDPYTSDITQSYGYLPGTSMAAPHVAGVAALMLSVNPNLTPAQIRTLLQNTADEVSGMSGQNFTNQYGYGRLNAYEAVKAALPVSSYGTYGSSQYSVHTLHWKEETLLGTTTITIPAGKALVVSDYVYATGPSYSKVVVHGTLILNEGAYWDATRFEIKSGGKMRLEGSNTLASVDIEVESGGLLDVRSGSTISMGTNQNLLSYGKVILDGTTIQNFISTRWGALTLSGSGTAGSSIVNSTITGSTNGVRLINAYDIHIDSSFLNNHLNNGLYAYGSSSIRITATEMNSNGVHGLLSDFSSIYFDPYSSFGGNDDGIRADGGSWLTFGTTNEEAFATSIGNTNGVHALYYSYVELGGPSYGGGSTIRNNASYNARAQDNSYIEAQYTWWGHSNPPGSMFNADGSSIIDRSNWLTHAAFKMNPAEVEPSESQNSDATRRAMAVQTIRRDMAASGTGIERWVDHTDADIRQAATMIRLATSLQSRDFGTATTLAGNLLERKDASPSERSAAYRALFLAEFMNGRPELASGYLSQSRTFGESDYLGYLSDLIESKGSDQIPTPIEEPSSITASVYPNPFNPSAIIGFQLPVDSQTRLTVYDILGREVAILVNGILSAGQHQVTFDGAGMASGIYMYRLQTGNQVITGKMMLMK